MNTKGNTILITGGATGIGLALAKAFVHAGSKVIICGRRENLLAEAKKEVPAIYTRKCDVTNDTERKALYDWVKTDFKDLNILINNAGIQKMADFTTGARELEKAGDEITTNLSAPIRLAALFTPLLMKQKAAAIFNVSSGLGFVPIAMMPVYCATKAGLHSFTISLRHQLRDTTVKVFEIIPPAVETELGREEGETEPGYPGFKAEVVSDAVIEAMAADRYEIPAGDAKGLVEGACKDFHGTFDNLNRW